MDDSASYTYKVNLDTDSPYEFEIVPVTEYNYKEAAACFAEGYTRESPLCVYFKMTPHDYAEARTIEACRETAKNNIGIACYCKTTNEIAGVIIHSDLPSIAEIKQFADPNTESIRRIRCVRYLQYKNLDIYQRMYDSGEKGYAQFGITTREKYSNLGLSTKLINFAVHEHPILKNARFFISDDVSPVVLDIHKAAGFKLVWSIKWEDFKNVEGLEYYAGFEDMMRNRGISYVNSFWLVLFDRHEYKKN